MFNLDTFRELLFVPRVSGQKSPITIMLEQGVMTPEHVSNLSKLFNSLETLKIAERQGSAWTRSRASARSVWSSGPRSWRPRPQVPCNGPRADGASIIVAGAVGKAAETVVSKIPASRVQDVAILLMNDPKGARGSDAQRDHSAGAHAPSAAVPLVAHPDRRHREPGLRSRRMFSQQESNHDYQHH